MVLCESKTEQHSKNNYQNKVTGEKKFFNQMPNKL